MKAREFLLILFFSHAVQAQTHEHFDAYFMGGAQAFSSSIASRQVLISLLDVLWSPLGRGLHIVSLLDSVEQLAALYTKHEPVVQQYNPVAYLAALMSWGLDFSYQFKNHDGSKRDRVFDQGKQDFLWFMTFVNGALSAWHIWDWYTDRLTPTVDVEAAWDDKRAIEWSKFLQQGDLNRRHQSDPVVHQWLKPVAGELILDAGCGEGYQTRYCAQQGAHVIGTDISPKMIDMARKISAENSGEVDYRVDSGDRLRTILDESVHHVVSNYVLMDCNDLEANIAAMYRVLKPGGTVIVIMVHPCFPLKATFEKSYFEEHVQRSKPFHSAFSEDFLIRHRPLEKYFEVFKQAGFVVEDFKEPHLSRSQRETLEPTIVKTLGERPISVAFKLRKAEAVPRETMGDAELDIGDFFTDKMLGCQVQMDMTNIGDCIWAKGSAKIKSLTKHRCEIEKSSSMVFERNIIAYRGHMELVFDYTGWTHGERRLFWGSLWVDNVWNHIWPGGKISMTIDASVGDGTKVFVNFDFKPTATHPCRPDNFVNNHVCHLFKPKMIEALKDVFAGAELVWQ